MELEESGGEEQRKVIRWERFLPRRSLRVLLVENDDSTRHIVAALLRKCSYIVVAVADGMKAWEVLQEKQYKLDLVLSEVDMPSLSGIDFLDKVTSCDLSRNIPVIMMSSQDSVNVVFKCMLKGAADFLVKPVRRNELRNLWQHVWRKHCSSSHTNTLERVNYDRGKSQDASVNDITANHENSDAESAPKSKHSDHCVGNTQASGYKSEAKTRKLQNEVLNAAEIKKSSKNRIECENELIAEESNKQHDFKNKKTGRSVGTDVSSCKHVLNSNQQENCTCQEMGNSDESTPAPENSCFIEEIGGNFCSSQSLCPNTRSAQIIDFIGAAVNKHDCTVLEKDSCNKDKTTTNETLVTHDISLRRSGLNGISDQGFPERRVLKHSSASAFSRYGKDNSDKKSGASTATLCTSPKESAGRFLPPEGTHQEEIASFSPWTSKTSAVYENYMPRNHKVASVSSNDGGNPRVNPPADASNASHSSTQIDEHHLDHSSDEVKHNSAAFHTSQFELRPFPFPVGGISIQNLYAGYGAFLQPLMYSEPSPSAPIRIHASKEANPSDHLGHQGSHPSYDHSSQKPPIQCHVVNERKAHTDERECREPNVYTCMDTEEQTDHHRSLPCHGESGRLDDITEYHGNLMISTHQGNDGGFQNACSNYVDHGKSHREAALMKFRLKRKDRCFEKKVRYHSRKMLAEQRPRIKGQFVRQTAVKCKPASTTGDEMTEYNCS